MRLMIWVVGIRLAKSTEPPAVLERSKGLVVGLDRCTYTGLTDCNRNGFPYHPRIRNREHQAGSIEWEVIGNLLKGIPSEQACFAHSCIYMFFSCCYFGPRYR